MNDHPVTAIDLSRRAFLGTSVLSLGSIALSNLLARADDDATCKLPKVTCKRVIMILTCRGLSQLDRFDEKPLLNLRRVAAAPPDMAQRLPARPLPRLPVPQRQGAGLLRRQPRRHRRQGPPPDSRQRQRPQPDRGNKDWRPRRDGPHPVLRVGCPYADE